MAVNVIIGFIVPGIKAQGDDCSKQESTDEKINGNAIANYFGQNSYLISSLKLMLETGFEVARFEICASMARLDLSVIFSYYITNSVIS